MHRLRQAPALDDAAVDRALSRLRDKVRDLGLKSSTVRDAVARAALKRRGHFSVDDLIADLGPNSDAHPATVYRVLPLLIDAGLIQTTLVSTGESARYERAFEREHHDHLICTGCGKVVEFHSEAIEALQQEIAQHFGFRLRAHVHELMGFCKACAGSGGSAPA